jgi:hypothetical protein
MPQVSRLSPEVCRSLPPVTRAQLVAARNRQLEPPEHPTVDATVERLSDAIGKSSLGAACRSDITPTARRDGAGGARRRHQRGGPMAMMRDRAHITFLGDIPYGGVPATSWGVDGHASIVVELLECAKAFGRRDVAATEPASDGLRKTVVRTRAKT